jgi:hypothetical protein
MDMYFVMISRNYDRIHLKIVYIERNNIPLTLYDSYVATILIIYNVTYAIISNQCGNFSPRYALCHSCSVYSYNWFQKRKANEMLFS